MDRGLHRGCVAAVGMFDGVHLGHRLLLGQVCDEARRRGIGAAIFTFDEHPLSLVRPEVAPRLLTTVSQRSDLLIDAGADAVNVLHFDAQMRMLTAREFMRMLKERYGVRVLVVGFNHRFGHDRIDDFESYARIGAEVGIEIVRGNAYVDADGCHVSSTAIRKAIKDGDLDTAQGMLGYRFTISGTVVHGQRIGHTIGFPTANISPFSQLQLLPKGGAYAAMVEVNRGELFPSMINIGTNPTVDDNKTLRIEAHIIGYDGDLYGMPVKATFVKRLRDERRFEDVNALAAQLALDRDATIAICAETEMR